LFLYNFCAKIYVFSDISSRFQENFFVWHKITFLTLSFVAFTYTKSNLKDKINGQKHFLTQKNSQFQNNTLTLQRICEN